MPRTTIEFSDAAVDELERLSKNLNTTKADVLRSALSLYSYIAEQLLNGPGRVLGVVNEGDGNRVEKIVVVPGLPFRRPVAKSGAAASGD